MPNPLATKRVADTVTLKNSVGVGWCPRLVEQEEIFFPLKALWLVWRSREERTRKSRNGRGQGNP
jgi:hypothetical protein